METLFKFAFIAFVILAVGKGLSSLDDLEDAQSAFEIVCEERGGVVLYSEYLLEHHFYCVDISVLLDSKVED